LELENVRCKKLQPGVYQDSAQAPRARVDCNKVEGSARPAETKAPEFEIGPEALLIERLNAKD
jgi:hypothetical protein